MSKWVQQLLIPSTPSIKKDVGTEGAKLVGSHNTPQAGGQTPISQEHLKSESRGLLMSHPNMPGIKRTLNYLLPF